MKQVKFWVLVLAPFALLVLHQNCQAKPPYHGTIFIENEIITADDPTAFESLRDAGHGERRMFDRRLNEFVKRDAWLFEAKYNDDLTLEVQVNPEFKQEVARQHAEKFAIVLGRLPHCLRVDAKTVWIHDGKELFGGGNNNFLIHIEQADEYERDGILEETLLHEGCHTSLDAYHSTSEGWKRAQAADGEFISNYAQENPLREDVAETFPLYLAVRYRSARIKPKNLESIQSTIKHRIDYFDALSLDLRPF